MTHRDEFIANVQSEPVIEVNPSFGLTFEQVEEKRKNGFDIESFAEEMRKLNRKPVSY